MLALLAQEAVLNHQDKYAACNIDTFYILCLATFGFRHIVISGVMRDPMRRRAALDRYPSERALCLADANRYGEEMSVGEVVDVIAAKLQEATMQGNRRPYGTGMLVAGFLPSDMEGPREALYKGMCEGGNDSPSPVLYRIEPSGAYTMWKACAIGRVSGEYEAADLWPRCLPKSEEELPHANTVSVIVSLH